LPIFAALVGVIVGVRWWRLWWGEVLYELNIFLYLEGEGKKVLW